MLFVLTVTVLTKIWRAKIYYPYWLVVDHSNCDLSIIKSNPNIRRLLQLILSSSIRSLLLPCSLCISIHHLFPLSFSLKPDYVKATLLVPETIPVHQEGDVGGK